MDKWFIKNFTENHGGKIKPTKIMIHCTGHNNHKIAVNWFKNPKSKTSAHFIFSRCGKVIQMVDTNIEAWHAGIGEYSGIPRNQGNKICLGFEIASTGGATGTFTDIQIQRVNTMISWAKNKFQIDEIISHEDYAGNRKSGDPGDNFPWDKIGVKR